MNIIKPPVFYKSREEAPKDAEILNTVEGSLKELFFIRNPRFKKTMPEAQEPLAKFLEENKPLTFLEKKVRGKSLETVFVYYPWLNKLIQIVPEEIYFELRTARNKNIITKDEQENYRNTKIGIAGLSIGSNVILMLVFTGGPKFMKIADFDDIEISNLNRLRAGLPEIGSNKTFSAAKQVWEVDPFAELELWDKGVSAESLREFILGNGSDKPCLDVFIDEMDSLELKILSRFICRENKIPALMATDNGDNVILDVERYDTDSDLPILHGLIGDIKPEDFKIMNYEDWLRLATKIVGFDNLTERMKQSLSEIGKTIAGVPQLGSTASIGAAAVALCVRKIANKQNLPSGRYFINIDKSLGF